MKYVEREYSSVIGTYYESYKTMEHGNDFNATCESKMSVPDNGKRKNMNTWGQKSQMAWKVVCQR